MATYGAHRKILNRNLDDFYISWYFQRMTWPFLQVFSNFYQSLQRISSFHNFFPTVLDIIEEQEKRSTSPKVFSFHIEFLKVSFLCSYEEGWRSIYRILNRIAIFRLKKVLLFWSFFAFYCQWWRDQYNKICGWFFSLTSEHFLGISVTKRRNWLESGLEDWRKSFLTFFPISNPFLSSRSQNFGKFGYIFCEQNFVNQFFMIFFGLLQKRRNIFRHGEKCKNQFPNLDF